MRRVWIDVERHRSTFDPVGEKDREESATGTEIEGTPPFPFVTAGSTNHGVRQKEEAGRT